MYRHPIRPTSTSVSNDHHAMKEGRKRFLGEPYEKSLLSPDGGCRPVGRLCAVWVLSRCWHVAGNAATIRVMKRTALQHKASANDGISYAGYRFPPDVISYAVWLYYRFPLSLRMVEELLAARAIDLTYETVRRW